MGFTNLISGLFRKKQTVKNYGVVKVFSRAEHHISRKDIHKNALKVLYRLHQHDYDAYLVGGGVRDLLLGKHPKDFDLATNAKPNQVKNLFRNCRLIGRRFRLAHVFFHDTLIEVSTFRACPSKAKHGQHERSEDGMILRDNVYGSIEEDAIRRDFTINALYYNIADFSIVDFVDGMKDLKAKIIRIIGDPVERYQEDPVRMLRAIRFAAKLHMQIEEKTAQPIYELAHLLTPISSSRLFDELLKLFHSGEAKRALLLLNEYKLLPALLSQTAKDFSQKATRDFICEGLNDTDKRIQSGKTTAIPFLFALLLWHSVKNKQQHLLETSKMRPSQALAEATFDIIREQNQRTTIPKRLQQAIFEIFLLQPQLHERRFRRIHAILNKPRFRAAFDLYCLSARVNQADQSVADWWHDLQEANPKERHSMVEERRSKKSSNTKSSAA